MAVIAELDSVEWTLSREEIPRFLKLAEEQGIQVLDFPAEGQDHRFRARVQMPFNNAPKYHSFALSVRPHHQSDS